MAVFAFNGQQKELDRYCGGSHSHVHLVAGKAAAAKVYPPDLCKAILRGCRKQMYQDGFMLCGHVGLQSHRKERVETDNTQSLGENKFVRYDELTSHFPSDGQLGDVLECCSTYWWFNNKPHYICIMTQAVFLKLLKDGHYKRPRVRDLPSVFDLRARHRRLP